MNAVEREVKLSVLRTFAGSAEEVCHQLDDADDEDGATVVAFVLDRSSADEAKVIARVLAQIIDLTDGSLAWLDEDALSKIVEILLPRESPSPTVLKEAQMLLRAKRAVLEGADWLTAAQVAEIAGVGRKNWGAQLAQWKGNGAIFAIRRNGTDYFPGYVLDPNTDYRPYRALKKILKQFDRAEDGWKLAFWFQSVNGFLGGKRPMDLLAKKPHEVIAAAADSAKPADHPWSGQS